MYGQADTQDKQKKKIIIVSLIMGIIIIVLIGVLINAITSKNKNNDKIAEETTLVREDTDKTQPTIVEENTKTEEPKAEEKKEEEVTPSSDVKSDTVPSTGPESILGLALVAGSATTYAFSKRKF